MTDVKGGRYFAQRMLKETQDDPPGFNVRRAVPEIPDEELIESLYIERQFALERIQELERHYRRTRAQLEHAHYELGEILRSKRFRLSHALSYVLHPERFFEEVDTKELVSQARDRLTERWSLLGGKHKDSDDRSAPAAEFKRDAVTTESVGREIEAYLRATGSSEPRHLILANEYPTTDSPYNNGFVHSRLRYYRSQVGDRFDVVAAHRRFEAERYEYDGVRVLRLPWSGVQQLLRRRAYESVNIHFLQPGLWREVTQVNELQARINIWVHGYEIQSWLRRRFNLVDYPQLKSAVRDWFVRRAFWTSVLERDDLNLVFVSAHFMNEILSDYAVLRPRASTHVIHNAIATDLFRYEPKDPEQRFRILLLRSFKSPKYANDIAIRCLLELAKSPLWERYQVRVIGRGELFDETVAPLRQYRNVTIEERFLVHEEIASIQRDYGIMLQPTRWDSHGVSRDEAMSSGMVPATNAVTAVPEFTDHSCAILAPAEDHLALASGILELANDPDRFLAMSEAAAARVRMQCSEANTARRELDLILGQGSSSR